MRRAQRNRKSWDRKKIFEKIIPKKKKIVSEKGKKMMGKTNGKR